MEDVGNHNSRNETQVADGSAGLDPSSERERIEINWMRGTWYDESGNEIPAGAKFESNSGRFVVRVRHWPGSDREMIYFKHFRDSRSGGDPVEEGGINRDTYWDINMDIPSEDKPDELELSPNPFDGDSNSTSRSGPDPMTRITLKFTKVGNK